MTVITISRQYGSSGDEVAQYISEALDYQIFSKSFIEQAAAETGLSEHDLESVSAGMSTGLTEENFKIRSFFDRMLYNMALTSARMMFPDALPSNIESNTPALNEDAAFALVQRAISLAYQKDNFVIVGRGGQVVLRDQPNVLHVRIVAPLEERIQRVKEQIRDADQQSGSTIDLRRAAQDLIASRDEASAAYLQHFYQVDWDDPLLYNLVINMGRTTIDQAVELIVEMSQ